MHVHVLHDWHVHAGRVHVLRWPGRLLFACGDYFLLKVRATARTQHNHSAHTRADSALFDHGPPPQETAHPTRVYVYVLRASVRASASA